MSAISKVVFTKQFLNKTDYEVITKPIGVTWEINYEVGWPLYNNHTYTQTIDGIDYKISDRDCRSVCFCSNKQCGRFNQYTTGHSDVTRRNTTSCKECNHNLTLKDCPVKVRFTHNITSNVFRMDHFGTHTHDQCSDYKRRKLNTIDAPIIDYPLYLALNYKNSCFIDAPIELLFNSVFPLLTL